MSTHALSFRKIFLVTLALLLLLASLKHDWKVERVEAASLTSASLRFDRLQINVSNVRVLVKFRPNDVTSLTRVQVDFASGIGVDGTPSNITTSTASLSPECTALTVTGSTANGNSSGQIAQFDVTGVNSTVTTYCFYITNGITNPGVAATEYNSTISTRTNAAELGSTIVTSYFASSDQVTVSAVVPPTFTFVLGSNSTSFTTGLTTSTIVSTTGVTGTVSTNATNGWSAYLRSSGSLHSTVQNYDINTVGSIDTTPETISAGSEFYQLDVDETTDNENNGSITGEYNGASNQGGTFNSTDLEEIATGTGSTDEYVFTMIGKAAISASTLSANDYTDTWTVVAAGNF